MTYKRIVPYGYYKDKITVSLKENPVEWKRQWGVFNKERKKALDFKNKDHINAIRRKRRRTEAGAKRIAADNKRYQKKHRKKLTQKYLDRRKNDPNFKLVYYLRTGVKDALKGRRKSKPTLKLLGCTIEELWKHFESNFQPGMTRENHGRWHIDHIRPCASFNLSDPEQQQKCFHYTNLQPLWAIDNMKKGSKIISGDITSPKM